MGIPISILVTSDTKGSRVISLLLWWLEWKVWLVLNGNKDLAVAT
jgi:hypothetical protein